MTLLKDNNYKEINVALLSLEADIKNKTGFDTSVIDRQLAEINSRIDKINAGSNNSSAEINDIRYEIENINSKLNAHSVRIESIEQKLSEIFSADSEVTDFNTTTNSGIYYWVGSSANKPGTDYGVLLVNKYDSRDGTSNLWINQVAYGTNSKIYFRQNIDSGNWTEWKAVAFEGEGKANFLDEYVGAGGTRLTSGNIVPKDTSEYGGMRKDVVTDSMTEGGYPGQDGHVLTMFWDNAGRYDSQFFVSNSNPPVLKARAKANETDYGAWKAVAYLDDIEKTTTKGVSLSTVTTRTTKYIKLGTFRWNDSFSFKCRIGGDCFEDNVNINILNGNTNLASVCGYYSTNSNHTKAVIVKRGDSWNSDIEIYLKVVQITTADVFVTIDKDYQDRINISESTTAPSGTLEEIVFNNNNGMFSGNIKASNKLVIPIGAPSSLEDGCIWIER